MVVVEGIICKIFKIFVQNVQEEAIKILPFLEGKKNVLNVQMGVKNVNLTEIVYNVLMNMH